MKRPAQGWWWEQWSISSCQDLIFQVKFQIQYRREGTPEKYMTLIMSNVIFVQTCHYSMCQKLFRCGARRRMAILESYTQLLAENINQLNISQVPQLTQEGRGT